MSETPALQEPPRRGGRRTLVAGILGLIALLFLALPPWSLDAKMRAVGYACCAQAPTRTLQIGAQFMPLDARDAGIYLSLLLCVGVAVAVGRGRSVTWPPGNMAALLAGLFMAMVLDGVNSSLETRHLHSFYHTTNSLRVITGAAAGLALAVLGLPVVNRLVWREPGDEPIAADYGELAGFVVVAIVAIALLFAPRAWLYYPLSILSTLGVLLGWGIVNGLVVVVATRRERRAITLADGGLLLLAGVVLTLGEMWVIDTLRAATSR